MAARKNLYHWLKAQVALIPNGNPLFGMAINLDVAEMVGTNDDRHFGLTLGDVSAVKLRNATRQLTDKDGQLEVIAYAHVSGRDKKDRSAQYDQVEEIIGWFEQQLETDPSANGALCPNAVLGPWRTPKRGDALDSQPYVMALSVLSYEEP